MNLIEKIVGYLPYGVNCKVKSNDFKDQIFTVLGMSNYSKTIEILNSDKGWLERDIEDIKLILKPMEIFLYKDFKDWHITELYKSDMSINTHFFVKAFLKLNYCYMHHYDIHGLIESGNAIDVGEL